MKPKTKLQKEVWELHKTIPEPKQHEPFMISKHEHYYTTHYKNLVCLECNHMWKPTKIWHEQVIGVKCPSCSKKLKQIKTENGAACRILLFTDVHVVDRFQVIRYFSCWKHMRKNKAPEYSFRALFEEWKDWDKDKRVIIGRTSTWTGDGFTSSTYEVRNTTGTLYKTNEYDRTASDFNCPEPKFLPRFAKFGIKEDYNCDFRTLLNSLVKNPIIETIYKAKRKELIFYSVHNDHNKKLNQYWPQIKIALRHNYKIKDVSIWYDYLDLLRYFGKDIHNPKFVCPENLKKAHDHWMNKKREVLRRQEEERELERKIKRQQKLDKAKKEYEARIARFLNLNFTSANISISVLKTVDEFKVEGEALKHCIFTNEYYLKKHSLLLSAKVDGKRTETVEVCLKTFKILQARGLGNEATQYNQMIVSIVTENMKLIQKLQHQKKSHRELLSS